MTADTEILIAELRRLIGDLAAGRNGAALAGELSARLDLLGANHERLYARLDEILQVVTAMTALDFRHKLELREDDDWLINALAIGLNIMSDELRRRSDALTETRDRALAANRAKTAFLANMSHELRTPLNAIIGYSELLRDELDPVLTSDQVGDLDRIVAAGRHLLTLIKDTLDLSKIEAGKVELNVELFAVDELVDEVTGTVHTLAESRGNRLVVQRGPELGIMRSDRTKLVQILFNLLSNAIKFTTLGTIRFSVERHGEVLGFVVEDTGIGIPRDKLDVVFGAFNQADEETARRFGGTGLGLTITRHFSEMMGGEITVTSEVGTGSTFTLKLPAEISEEPRRKRRAGVRRPLARDLGLVVSDDPCLLEALHQLLAPLGVPLVPASALDGPRLATVLHPAFVVLDDRLPDLGSVLLTFATDPELAILPRFVAGDLPPGDIAVRGAAEALPRPLRRAAVLAAIRPHLRAPPPLGEVVFVGGGVAVAPPAAPFTARGWRVAVATTPEALRDHLETSPPDAVVLDLAGPYASEAAEVLRRHPGGRRRAVIGVGTGREPATAVCTEVLRAEEFTLETLLAALAVQVHASGLRDVVP